MTSDDKEVPQPLDAEPDGPPAVDSEEDLLGFGQDLFSVLPEGVKMYVTEEQLYQVDYLNGSQIYREPFVIITLDKDYIDTAKGGLNTALATLGTALAETVIGPVLVGALGLAANMWVDGNCNEDGSADVYLAKHYAGTRQGGIDVTAFPIPGVPTMVWDGAIDGLIQGINEMSPSGIKFGSTSLSITAGNDKNMSVEVPPLPEVEEEEESAQAGIESAGGAPRKSINQAYVFVRWSGAPLPGGRHAGHVGWGFVGRNGEGKIIYIGGATEGVRNPPNPLAGAYVPEYGDAGAWAKVFASEEELLKTMAGEPYNYDAYKVIPVRASRWEYAYRTGQWMKKKGYTALTNNCLDHTIAVLKAYGVTDLHTAQSCPQPKTWYNRLPGESRNL